MSKIKLTGSNSGYVEIDSAADAGNLTLQLPTSGTRLLSNADNVFTGVTTTAQLDINGSIDISSTSIFNDDVTFKGASYDVVWDSSDNALEFGTNAKATFGGAMQLYHDGSNSLIQDSGTGHVQIRSGTFTVGNAGLTKTSAIFNSGSGQQLNFNNNQKFITTNTGVVVTGICTATSFSGDGSALTGVSSPLSFRNLVINGAMEVAQRGTSYQGVHNSTATYYKTIDRMHRADGVINADNSTFQHALTSSDTGPWEEGFRYSLMIRSEYQGSVNASRFVGFSHRIENRNVASSGWNYTSASSYITLSYWVKSSLAINYYGHLRTLSGTDQRYAFETGTLTAGQWTKITKTIPGNSNLVFTPTNDEGLRIDLSPYYGTDFTDAGVSLNAWGAHSNSTKTPVYPTNFFVTNQATFEVTGLQLEVGSTATAFEHRNFAEELERCKRYFFILGKDVHRNRTQLSMPFINEHPSNRSGYINLRFNPEMRGTPTVTIGSELQLGRPQVDMSSHKVSNFGNPHATGTHYFQYTNQTGNTGDANKYMRIGHHDDSYAEFSAEL